ncbi:MAG: T9SS type A sorting domain-containing protein [Saprospiraceae bacterium]|nr:T9SS type A sorting domain-containing protein [Candidatus Defluviibacterium haderslevense]
MKKNQISVFPNPTSKYLNISLNNDDHFNFEIINAVGVLVMKGKYQNKIDISSLTDGIYFINLEQGRHQMTKKFVKCGN